MDSVQIRIYYYYCLHIGERESEIEMALMLSVNMVDIIAYFTSLQLCR